jgi:hypothetical protein
LCLVRLANDRFRCDHTGSTGLSSWAYGGYRQPGPARNNLRHRLTDVGVQLLPDEYDRVTEVMMGGIQQPGVVGLGQPRALTGPAPAAGMGAVDQPGRWPGRTRSLRARSHASSPPPSGYLISSV